jgi:3'-phosphoadenosine 5'-phosphosulfate sulfotransferase (PAPS reductase)/FAD synthetase
MSQQQQLLKQELTVSQILRTYGKQFKQIQLQYSDGLNGRCAMGVIMSYFGWNGKDDSSAATKLMAALIALRHARIDKDLLIDLNDTGYTFDEIADYLDRANELTTLK